MSDSTACGQQHTQAGAAMVSEPDARPNPVSVVRTGSVAALLLVVLAGCSAAGGVASPTIGSSASATGPASTSPSATASPVPSSPGPSATATQSPTLDAATAALKATMESTLQATVSGAAIPEQERLRTALTAAGIPAENLEVSVSRTPTGLDVDAIEAAAKSGHNCVIGQIRDGRVSATVLPALASGKCFVGDSR